MLIFNRRKYLNTEQQTRFVIVYDTNYITEMPINLNCYKFRYTWLGKVVADVYAAMTMTKVIPFEDYKDLSDITRMQYSILMWHWVEWLFLILHESNMFKINGC